MLKKIFILFSIVCSCYANAQTIAYPTVNDSYNGASCIDLHYSNTAVVSHQLTVTVVYYETLNDANNETNPLGRYYPTPTFPHTIYARVDSTIDNSFDIAENELEHWGYDNPIPEPCEPSGGQGPTGGQGPPCSGPGPGNKGSNKDSLNVPIPPPAGCSLKVCDSDGDGVEYVNLKQIQCTSSDYYPNGSFCSIDESDSEKSFYLSLEDAQNGVNELDELYLINDFNSVSISYKFVNTSMNEYSEYEYAIIPGTIVITMVNCTDDTDGDGIKDMAEDPNGNLDYLDDDTDLDGIPNYMDDDDDGDGILTINEDWNNNGDPTDDDTNNNSIADYLEANVITLSIEKSSLLDFKIYPNPTKGIVNIQSNNPIKKIIIYNNLGMKLVEKVLINKSIDISELASGLHFIEINDFDGNKVTRKLIKE